MNSKENWLSLASYTKQYTWLLAISNTFTSRYCFRYSSHASLSLTGSINGSSKNLIKANFESQNQNGDKSISCAVETTRMFADNSGSDSCSLHHFHTHHRTRSEDRTESLAEVGRMSDATSVSGKHVSDETGRCLNTITVFRPHGSKQ